MELAQLRRTGLGLAVVAGSLACSPDPKPADRTTGTGDPTISPECGDSGPDPILLERVNAGLEAWGIELETDLLADGRNLGDDQRTHSPANWITVADNGCDSLGIPHDTECEFDSTVVGFCELRFLSSGEIVDTTLVVFEDFQFDEDTDEIDRAKIFAHEIGHCLGLRHTDSPQRIMFPTIDGADEPADDELDAIAAAYLPVGPPDQESAQGYYSLVDEGGAPIRQFEFPKFRISCAMGNEGGTDDRALPTPGRAIDQPIFTRRHLMRADGSCISTP